MMSFVPDAARLDSLSIGLFFAATACLLVGLLWLWTLAIIALLKGWKRARWPIGLLLLGLVLGSLPLLWTTFGSEVVDLGPRERIVEGEQHITLTGWDHPAADYALLKQRPGAAVLQMANPDVTDEVVASLAGMEKLRELDLSGSAITDAALPTLAALPALARLRIGQTAVTEAGFRAHLLGKESLDQIEVRGTAIEPATIAEWKEMKPGRRALGP
jgi:hypothetical protein